MVAWQVLPTLPAAGTGTCPYSLKSLMLEQHFSPAFSALWEMTVGRAGPWGNAPNVTHWAGEALPSWGKLGWPSPFRLHATGEQVSIHCRQLHLVNNSSLSGRCLHIGLSLKRGEKPVFG